MEHRLEGVRDRYLRDVEFRVLVDMLLGQVIEGSYTPEELRQAVLLSHILYRERYPPWSMVLSREEAMALGLKVKEK